LEALIILKLWGRTASVGTPFKGGMQYEIASLLTAFGNEKIAKEIEEELSMKRYDPKPFVEDVVMKDPSELPPTVPQRAATHIDHQQVASFLATAAQQVPFLFREQQQQQPREKQLTREEALLALAVPRPPSLGGVVSEDDPRLKSVPSRIRKSIINTTHSSDEGKAKLYSIPFDERVSFIDAALKESRYGSPLDMDYPSAQSVRKSDPFVRLARATKPSGNYSSLEVFANNVPTWLTADQLKSLGSIYVANYNVVNDGDLIGGLFQIGMGEAIDQADLIRVTESAEKTPSLLELAQFLSKMVRSFVASTVNVIKLASLAGMFIYGVSLNESRAVDALKIAAETDLVDKLTSSDASQIMLNLMSHRKIPSFFDMKQFQSLAHLRRDSFYFRDGGSCPLFSKYAHATLISAGTFGFVISTLPREGNPGIPGYKYPVDQDASLEEEEILLRSPMLAVKVQPISKEEAEYRVQEDSIPYVEVRVMQVIKELSDHWEPIHLASGVFNHVRLDDFARCEFDAQKEFAPLLIGERPERIKKFIRPGKQLYQLIVQEYADMGNLHNMIVRKGSTSGLKLMCDWRNFAAVTIQVMGFIQSLASHGYTHRDIKPLNVLLKKISPSSKVQFLAYMGVSSGDRKDLYVPAWGLGVVVKVADQGSANIQGRARLPAGERITTYIPSPQTRRTYGYIYNPAFDLECYALGILSSILRGCSINNINFDILGSIIDLEIIQWIQGCIHQGPYPNPAMTECYAIVTKFLKTIQDYDLEAPISSVGISYANVVSALDDIYTKHNRLWQAEKIPYSKDAISRALAHKMFDPFREVPDSDTTVANGGIVVMTDYRYVD
jgi:serine/threonine protein kinase